MEVYTVRKLAAMFYIAISYCNDDNTCNTPITLCGLCRQALRENVYKTGKPIRLILAGLQGIVMIIPETSILLPFSFTGKELGK